MNVEQDFDNLPLTTQSLLNGNGRGGAMVRSLVAFIQRWLQADRIRISPVEGRLLRLRAGQKMLLRDAVYHVRDVPSPDVTESQDLIIVLEGDHGVARLTVHRTASGGCAAAQLVAENGQSLDIFDDDVQLLQRGSMNPVESHRAQ